MTCHYRMGHCMVGKCNFVSKTTNNMTGLAGLARCTVFQYCVVLISDLLCEKSPFRLVIDLSDLVWVWYIDQFQESSCNLQSERVVLWAFVLVY